VPIGHDLRVAIRSLLHDRGYTAVALLTLAFGIAANTIIFSIVDGVLLRPLPYREPGRLIVINEVIKELAGTYPRLPVAASHYLEWRDRAASFAEIGIAESGRAILSGPGDPGQLDEARVSASLLPLLGARPQLGRTFLAEEDQPDRDRVVVISDGLWARRFGRDRGVIGRSVTLDGVPKTIIGVLPASFHLPKSDPSQFMAMPSRADVYVPIAFRPAKLDIQGPFNYAVVARLKPGTTERQAVAELNALEAGIAARLTEKMHLSVLTRGLHEEVAGASRTPLLILLGAVGAVLLIVCVNLANLALARGAARSRDVAIRLALGATRWQLVRSLASESVCLAVAGAALGLAAAWAGLRFLLSSAPLDIPRLDEVGIDARGLLFVAALSALTTVLFGLFPAWNAASADPQAALRDASRGTTEGRGGRATRQALVALESALGAVLLIVAGLLLASFVRLLDVNKGFDPEHVVTAHLTLPHQADADPKVRQARFAQVLDHLETMPGTAGAGIVSYLPLEGETWVDVVQKEGDARPMAELPPVNFRFCSADYFRAMGLTFVAGGPFSDADRTRNLAIVSEATARQVWPNENPVGKKFRRGDPKEPFIEVAGVARDVKVDLAAKAVATVYVPYWSTDERQPMRLVVRSQSNPEAVARSLRQAVASVDRDAVVDHVRTMDAVVSGSVAVRRFQLVLTAGFAGAALLLACLGIYGVVAWSVARRRGEIGVRMALGARAGDVRAMVVGQGMRPVLVGLAIGVGAALALGRVLGSLLFGVSAHDPATIAAVVVALASIGTLACYLPARRATLADPLRALRCD
jgi:predicted permease